MPLGDGPSSRVYGEYAFVMYCVVLVGYQPTLEKLLLHAPAVFAAYSREVDVSDLRSRVISIVSAPDARKFSV